MAHSYSERSTLAVWDADRNAGAHPKKGRERAGGPGSRDCAGRRGTAPGRRVRTYLRPRARRRGERETRRPLCPACRRSSKISTQIRDVPTTWGSQAVGRYVSRGTDPIATWIEETGVVTLGKSACPELGLMPTTEPLGRPPCRNPWDPSRSSGGSSGGAATLVAGGVVPIAHGNDGGGSVRIPAASCGLVGLKPSRFRLDMKGSNLLAVNIACEGVVTRTVRDTVAFYAAIESRHAPRRLAPIGQVARQTREAAAHGRLRRRTRRHAGGSRGAKGRAGGGPSLRDAGPRGGGDPVSVRGLGPRRLPHDTGPSSPGSRSGRVGWACTGASIGRRSNPGPWDSWALHSGEARRDLRPRSLCAASRRRSRR